MLPSSCGAGPLYRAPCAVEKRTDGTTATLRRESKSSSVNELRIVLLFCGLPHLPPSVHDRTKLFRSKQSKMTLYLAVFGSFLMTESWTLLETSALPSPTLWNGERSRCAVFLLYVEVMNYHSHQSSAILSKRGMHGAR